MRENALVLFEFMRNLEYLIGVVNEVVSKPQTRAALKADASFKPIRNVIKWCTKLMETNFLVERRRRRRPATNKSNTNHSTMNHQESRRLHTKDNNDPNPQKDDENGEEEEDPAAENNATNDVVTTGLQLRLVAAHQTRDVKKLRSWNGKLTKAVASVFDGIPSSTTSNTTGNNSTTHPGGEVGGPTMSLDDDDFTDDETDGTKPLTPTLSFEETTMEMGSIMSSPSANSSLSQPTPEYNLSDVQSRAQCMNVICRLWLEKQKKDMEGRYVSFYCSGSCMFLVVPMCVCFFEKSDPW
jgi:hypothetical protein